MERLARRQMLQLFFAAGVAAATGLSATKVVAGEPAAVAGSLPEPSLASLDGVAGEAETGFASELEPDQSVVIRRPGRYRRGRYGRGGPRVIVRPGSPWRRRRRRIVCVRRRNGRLVCRPRW